MSRKARIGNDNLVHEILNSGSNPFPPFHPELNWVDCPSGNVGDGYTGTAFISPPDSTSDFNGAAWVSNPTKAAQVTQTTSDALDKQAAQADTVIQFLLTHTPAECSAFVGTNVTNLATAVNMLQKFSIALCVLAKSNLR